MDKKIIGIVMCACLSFGIMFRFAGSDVFGFGVLSGMLLVVSAYEIIGWITKKAKGDG